jgi:predicted permease
VAFIRDLRFGVRQLARQRAFTAAAVASLALGIGLNTTLFSVVNGVLLRDSPLAAPDRLVEVYSGAGEDYPQLTTSYPDYLDIARGADAFASVAANAHVRGILSGAERGVVVTGEAVTANYFDVLGLRPSPGRSFRDEEDGAPGASPVVVLSHGLWQGRFGGVASVIGTEVLLSGNSYTVVGVAPRGFTGTMPGVPTDFWVPVTMVESFVFAGVQWTTDVNPGANRLDRRGTRWLFVKGRLAEGRTVEEARAQVQTVFARLRAEYPGSHDKVTASVLPASNIRFHPMLDGYIKTASTGLLIAVGLVLLVACANVANLLLARGVARRREFAIRAAIGASRGRLIRQLLAEGFVLGGAGGSLGLLIAWWASRAMTGFGTGVFPMPISFDFSIDGRVLAFAVLTSLGTALVFGLMPAWASSRLDLVPALKEVAEGQARRRMTLKNLLVVAQLAMSLLLLVAGALLIRGLLAARGTDIGYDPRVVSSLSFNLQMNGYTPERARAFAERALDSVRALPGVMAVSTASRLPLAPDINMTGIKVPGYHTSEADESVVDIATVGADYFAAVGVPMLEGRAFSPEEAAQGRRVAIVNETMARQFWPKGSVVGSRLYTSGYQSEPYVIVGVSRDHKVRSVGEAPRPYVHLAGAPAQDIGLVIRTATPAESALPMLRRTLWSLEPNIAFTEDASAADIAEVTMAPTRLGAIAAMAFGMLALLLAMVGLYGVVAYSASQRRKEVGIRMALGAARGQVLRLIFFEGGRLAVLGIVVGTLAAALVGRLLESLLYGVSGFDPLAYGLAAGGLLLMACIANLGPALTAARVDPLHALRNE